MVRENIRKLSSSVGINPFGVEEAKKKVNPDTTTNPPMVHHLLKIAHFTNLRYCTVNLSNTLSNFLRPTVLKNLNLYTPLEDLIFPIRLSFWTFFFLSLPKIKALKTGTKVKALIAEINTANMMVKANSL